MGNNAYIIPDKMPEPDAVSKVIQAFAARRFPGFTVTYDPPDQYGFGGWTIDSAEFPEHLLVGLWFDTCHDWKHADPLDVDHERVQEKSGLRISKARMDVNWWIRGEYINEFLRNFPGYWYDEGDFTPTDAAPEIPTFYDWLKQKWQHSPFVVNGVVRHDRIASDAEMQREDLQCLPSEIYRLLGFPPFAKTPVYGFDGGIIPDAVNPSCIDYRTFDL